MPHSCGDLDVPVISVCGTEVLMEKFDIQKLVVYATDLDEKNTSRTSFWPFRTRDGQIEDWNKKIEPSPLCSLFRWKGRRTPSCTSACPWAWAWPWAWTWPMEIWRRPSSVAGGGLLFVAMVFAEIV